MRLRIGRRRYSVHPRNRRGYFIGSFPWALIRVGSGSLGRPRRCWSCRVQCPPGTWAYVPTSDPPHRDLNIRSLLCRTCVEEAAMTIQSDDESGETYDWIRAMCHHDKGIVVITYQVSGLETESGDLIEDFDETWTHDDVRETVASMLGVAEKYAKEIEVLDD